ncbi:MAG TPA: hypothetical protein PLC88_02785 [Syntrophomonas sp.]|nr:hypothetical protein [Syntrophomonas sp.]HRW11711.1 hypothetical protein [Syntrophomonas sp.]
MNETSLNHCILAIVCRRPEKVSGACPTFIAASQEEQQNICLLLARILGGIVHDLENGVYIIVKH